MNSDRRDWKLAVIFGIILCGLVFASIFIQPYKSGAEYRGLKDYSEDDGTAMIPLKVNDFELTLNTHAPETAYDVGWLTTEQDTVISIGEFRAERVWINEREIKSGETISLRLDSLNRQENIVVKIQDDRSDWVRQIYIRTIPENFPDLEVDHYASIEDADHTYCFAIGDFLVKMDTSGNIVYYRASVGATQFRPYYNEKKACVRYSFLEQTGQNPLTSMPEYKAVIMDEKYNVIDIIDGAKRSGQEDEFIPLTVGGFFYIEDGHYLIAAANPTVVYNIPDKLPHEPMGAHIIENFVQEIKDGVPVWTWESAQHPELYLESNQEFLERGKEYIDYAHLSGVFYTKGRTALIRFEYLNSIIAISENGNKWYTCAKINGNADIACTANGMILLYTLSDGGDLNEADLDSLQFVRTINVGRNLYQPYSSATYYEPLDLLGIAWHAESGAQLFTIYDLSKKQIVMELQNRTVQTNPELCVDYIFID